MGDSVAPGPLARFRPDCSAQSATSRSAGLEAGAVDARPDADFSCDTNRAICHGSTVFLSFSKREAVEPHQRFLF